MLEPSQQHRRVHNKDAPQERRARPSDPWLTPIDPLVERDYVWSGYIDVRPRSEPLSQAAIDMIKHQVCDFHSKRMNASPHIASSLTYLSQKSLRFSLMA